MVRARLRVVGWPKFEVRFRVFVGVWVRVKVRVRVQPLTRRARPFPGGTRTSSGLRAYGTSVGVLTYGMTIQLLKLNQ